MVDLRFTNAMHYCDIKLIESSRNVNKTEKNINNLYLPPKPNLIQIFLGKKVFRHVLKVDSLLCCLPERGRKLHAAGPKTESEN